MESSTATGFSPLRMGVDSQERCAESHAFDSTRYEAVIAAGRAMSVLDEFKSSELIYTRTIYSFSSEKLVIFENDPLSNHWRIA